MEVGVFFRMVETASIIIEQIEDNWTAWVAPNSEGRRTSVNRLSKLNIA